MSHSETGTPPSFEEKDVYIDPKSLTHHSDKSNSDIVERYTDDEKRLHLDDLNRHTDEEEDPYTHGDPTELKEADIQDDHIDTDVEPQTREQFDWDIVDDDDSLLEENKPTESKIGNSRLFQCLASNSSSIAWSLNIVFGLIVIGVAIIIHVVYDDLEKPDASVGLSNIALSLELWFTWLAFMWVISVAMHFFVEVIPWCIKTLFKIIMPSKTEITRMRLAYYNALRTYIKLILIWAWGWGAWAFLRVFPNNLTRSDRQASFGYTGTFQVIWQCCFFLALMVFIEKFILQLIVTAFHRKAYSTRIAHNDHALTVLDRLKKGKRRFNYGKGRRTKSSSNTNSARPSLENSQRDSISGDDMGTLPIDEKKRTNRKLKRNGDEKSNVRFARNDTRIPMPDEKMKDETPAYLGRPSMPSRPSSNDFFSTLTQKLKGLKANEDSPRQQNDRPTISRLSSRSSTFDSAKTLVHGGKDTALAIPNLIKNGFNIKSVYNTILPPSGTSQQQAKDLARQIYASLKPAGADRDYLVEADLYSHFRTKEEAAKAFQLFDKDGNGDISRRELRNGCIRIYKERKLLSASMRDLSQASGKLDVILLTIAAIIWAVIVCASFGINVGTSLMPLWTMFVAVSFIFGNSAKDMFESIIFIFVTHPYDIGDRVFIGTENWQVKSMGLLITTFLKWDGTTVYVKNSVLAPLYIFNVSRSGPMGETVDIHLHFRTPAWKIDSLRDHMQEWYNTEGKGFTYNSHGMNIITFDQLNKITATIYMEHKQNWSDSGKRWASRNAYMMKLKEVLETLEISYTLPPMPVATRNDAPDEIYNFGNKTGYGMEGLASGGSSDSTHYRRGYRYSEKGQDGMLGGGGSTAAGGSNDAAPGPAAALVFASQM
ncbi:hypothetical protein K450DRAFT_262205 [Umbelopsis ramanniana AG]|uniref:EF-hand domain-containing protein n=1 Tax=Umbelopsis ramanniana AG TaxID=1314678 RepID=A0AAD5H7R2_UMBRA|nr:uncharacterized protein K450DRAFT_262205 [Umbelopsis ramanniana AG]KAI8575355.1 hypothetical protein K450DRAFT_262205 [Umbelopsis ramanniana AG]